jgi:ABC-type antimicrobial peptide transport system permease subunit
MGKPMRTRAVPTILSPLTPTTFLVRNLGKALPLIGVILLAIMLISGIVALINSIPLSIRTIYLYSKEFVAVTPRGDPMMPPKFVARIQSESPVPVERIMLVRATGTLVKSIVGEWPFANLGLKPQDRDYFLKRMNVTGVVGRLPKAGEPEAAVSELVARNLKLKIGSALQGPENQDAYSPSNVVIVGILKTDKWLMIGDYDYQRANHFPPVDGVLAFAKTTEDQRTLDEWALKSFVGERAQVLAYSDLESDTNDMFKILYQILNVVIGILVVVITIMMGMLINIHQSQRIQEFGLLQALGYTKREIVMRVVKESALVVSIGWFLGVGVSVLLLMLVDATLMRPNAFALDALDLGAILNTVPVPVAIFAVAVATVVRRFRGFDPVGIVERRLV